MIIGNEGGGIASKFVLDGYVGATLTTSLSLIPAAPVFDRTLPHWLGMSGTYLCKMGI